MDPSLTSGVSAPPTNEPFSDSFVHDSQSSPLLPLPSSLLSLLSQSGLQSTSPLPLIPPDPPRATSPSPTTPSASTTPSLESGTGAPSNATKALVGTIAALVTAGMLALIGVILWRRRRRRRPRNVRLISDDVHLEPFSFQDEFGTTHLLSMFPDAPSFSAAAQGGARRG
ncbi:hypothetical protein CC85DRAFT_329491 [Cutaneotrichosporon oleaginosum]|uniref:Uncharacterized protein n=1 Tax=Cutaneotrichosporon oleaginosum TaxID=879819 RepID=A0A0J1B016_9TREE|nr:uncharacterized protein CC85DRAFT_329491 [Cutaneotrichosporon oleaginosum]KLT40929.1 hypothetical protein CC85DRAFT_329491 [Cutaneotrichosporon oleaginosum]TXT15422.1 hypothetical protein COLE_01615 [Cutaneotrichosporon oleaginosum]